MDPRRDVRGVGGGAARRRRAARRARARVRRALRGPRPAARRAGRAGLRRPGAARAAAAARSARTCARASRPAGATCSSTTSQDPDAPPRLRAVGCSAAEHGDLAAHGRRRPGDRRAARRRRPAARRCCDTDRRAPGSRSCGWPRSLRCPDACPGRRRGRRRADRRPAGEGARAARRRRPAATCASGAARASAPRPRAWRPTSSGWCARASRPGGSACSCARCATRARSSRSRSRSARCRSGWPARRRSSAQAEVRDVLAWLRLLVDPGDAGAVVRALARPPIELHSVDLARCIQIARRRKLDMVSGLVAATESPQLPPEARERVLAFLKLHRAGRRRAGHDAPRPLRAPADRAPRACAASRSSPRRPTSSSGSSSLARVGELAASYVRRAPQATPREFARWLAAVAEAGRDRRRRGRGRHAAARRRGRRAADARRQGAGVRPRLRLRPAVLADAGRAAPARSSRSPPSCWSEPGGAGRLARGARRRDAARAARRR